MNDKKPIFPSQSYDLDFNYIMSYTNYKVLESLYHFEAFDDSLQSHKFTYHLITISDSIKSLFLLDPSGELYINTTHLKQMDVKAGYHIFKIQANNSNGLNSLSVNVNVYIRDKSGDEEFIKLYSDFEAQFNSDYYVSESTSIGSTVVSYKLSTINNNHHLRCIIDYPSRWFAINTFNQTCELKVNGTLDYEVYKTAVLNMRINFENTIMLRPIKIHLIDENDRPEFIADTFIGNIHDNQSDGDVLTVMAYDPDKSEAFGNISYHLISSDPILLSSLQINPSGVVSIKERIESYSGEIQLQVLATDGYYNITANIYIKIHITITPTFEIGNYSFDVSDNATLNSKIGIIQINGISKYNMFNIWTNNFIVQFRHSTANNSVQNCSN